MSDTHAEQSFLRKYIFSTDHKMIGKQYLLTAIFMGIFAVAWSVLIRVQIAWPDGTWPILSTLFPGLYESGVLLPERYLSLVTMHGSLMVFFVISFALVSGIGNFIIPLHVGARLDDSGSHTGRLKQMHYLFGGVLQRPGFNQ